MPPLDSLVMIHTEKSHGPGLSSRVYTPKRESRGTSDQPYWFKAVILKR
jgi:hypothetical protein